MKIFCDNPECQLHVMVKFEMRTIEIERLDRRIQVTQHIYENNSGNKAFHLCSICHAAVELVKKSQ
jgi:cytochrome c2